MLSVPSQKMHFPYHVAEIHSEPMNGRVAPPTFIDLMNILQVSL